MNEMFFIALYLLSFSSPLLSPTLFSDLNNDRIARHIDRFLADKGLD